MYTPARCQAMCCIRLPPSQHRAGQQRFQHRLVPAALHVIQLLMGEEAAQQGPVWGIFADKLLEHLRKCDKQCRMCLLFGFRKEVTYMPETRSYVGAIVSCKMNSAEHGQRWAGEVLGESRGVLGGRVSGAAPRLPGSCFSLFMPKLREKSRKVWSGQSCN